MRKEPKKIKLEDILPKYTLDDIIVDEEAHNEAVEEAEAEIDRLLGILEKHIGRGLVDIERRAVLDIVEETSTKDKWGNIVLFSSFIQAWKIYEYRCGESSRRD